MKWPENELTAPYTVEVTSFTETPPRLLWKTQTNSTHLQYPDTGPTLSVGLPYRIRVVGANDRSATAVFVSENKDSTGDDPLEALVPIRR